MAKLCGCAARRNPTARNDAATSETADALLDDILGGLGSDATPLPARSAGCIQQMLLYADCLPRYLRSSSASFATHNPFPHLLHAKMQTLLCCNSLLRLDASARFFLQPVVPCRVMSQDCTCTGRSRQLLHGLLRGPTELPGACSSPQKPHRIALPLPFSTLLHGKPLPPPENTGQSHLKQCSPPHVMRSSH